MSDSPSRRAGPAECSSVRQWKHLMVPFVPVAGFVVALTVGQGDLGTAVVLMAVVLTLLWVVGVPTWLFSLAVGTMAVIGVYFVMSAQHRLDRVRLFLNPFADTDDRTFQAVHSIYAFSNGGWWGRGLGGSVEKWGGLPEAHTDFIFAIIGEELGLPGTREFGSPGARATRSSVSQRRASRAGCWSRHW